MGKPILRIENLVKRYKDGFTLEIQSMEFQAQKIYSIVGPNGAGKTTLLKLISLLEEPDSGKIFYDGEEVADSSSRLNIRRNLCMVMENPILFRTTVFKNIISGLKFQSIDKNLWRQREEEAIKMVGLEALGKRHSDTLSRGEVQRVAIARALVLKPKVLLLDEPFTNIDKKNIELIEQLIKTIPDTTIIFTTHDFMQAYRLADEVISMVDGKVVNGSIENLFSGEIEEMNGSKFVTISPSVRFYVVTEKTGKVHISVDPEAIIISHHQLQSSARNSFKGIIRKIQLEGQIARVSVDVGIELVALITAVSYRKMNLYVGSEVFVTFKSTSIKVF